MFVTPSVENRDFFEPGGSKTLCEVIAYHVDNIEIHSDSSLKIITAGLSLARCVSKAENNKGQLMRYGMGELINKLLSMSRPQDGESWENLLRNACHVLRGLSIHDDYRKDMSSAHDNGRSIENICKFDDILIKLHSWLTVAMSPNYLDA